MIAKMRILLAVDGSECSDAAVAEVASRPWPSCSEIKVITAYELPLMPAPAAWAISPDYCRDLEHAVSQYARSSSEGAQRKLTETLGEIYTVTSQILIGSPKSVILDMAESWDADLIVVGSHGYRVWERFLLGSVSQAVVSHAKCSVEVVRCKASAVKETKT